MIRALRIRALDNVGAYAGPLAAAARQAGRRDRRALPHRARSQYEPIVGDDQQDAAGSGARLRPGADQLRASRRAHRPASRSYLGMDRIELRRRNFIRKDEFPYLIPSGTTYDSRRLPHRARQGAGRMPTSRRSSRERDALRAAGMLAGIGIADLPGAERRQLRVRAAAQSEERRPRPGWTPAWSRVDLLRRDHRRDGHVVVGPGPRDAGRRPSSAKSWSAIPTASAWCAPTRCKACRPTARSAAAWRSCWAARRPARRARSRRKLIAIAAHNFGCAPKRARLRTTATSA